MYVPVRIVMRNWRHTFIIGLATRVLEEGADVSYDIKAMLLQELQEKELMLKRKNAKKDIGSDHCSSACGRYSDDFAVHGYPSASGSLLDGGFQRIRWVTGRE